MTRDPLTFERCPSCRYWLWPDDGKYHSLEPKLFFDCGGTVEMRRCITCADPECEACRASRADALAEADVQVSALHDALYERVLADGERDALNAEVWKLHDILRAALADAEPKEPQR